MSNNPEPMVLLEKAVKDLELNDIDVQFTGPRPNMVVCYLRSKRTGQVIVEGRGITKATALWSAMLDAVDNYANLG